MVDKTEKNISNEKKRRYLLGVSITLCSILTGLSISGEIKHQNAEKSCLLEPANENVSYTESKTDLKIDEKCLKNALTKANSH